MALGIGAEDPVGEWLALLPDVSGWGATELSELLLSTEDERACGVLLRRGAAIGNALDLAVGCRLHQALDDDDIDDELFRGAQSIIDDLTWAPSGPDTLLEYPDAGPAVERFLELLDERASALGDLLTTDGILRFLDPQPQADDERFAVIGDLEERDVPDPDEAARGLAEVGLDDARIERVRASGRAIVERPEWRLRVESALESEDERERNLAIEAAKVLGLALRPYLVRKIEAGPNDSTLWFHFAFGANAEQIAEVVRLAERVLDLNALASGPALELFGPSEAEGPHQAADYVLQELPRFPGVGERLLVAALESPVIRHRLRALEAFARWPRETLDASVLAAVGRRRNDPDEDVRIAAAAVFAGEPIPEPRVDDEDADAED